MQRKGIRIEIKLSKHFYKVVVFIGTSPRSLIKELEKAGFTYVRTSGSHVIYFKKGIGPIPVPVHGNKDIPIGTFESLRKKAGLK